MEPIPAAVIDYLGQHYPRPRVDTDWLKACYDWVVEDKALNPATQMTAIIKEVEDQLLSSNLQDSMMHGTGLPVHIPDTSVKQTRISGPPVLVEIVSITDIGVSAYNLNKVRITREEREAAGEVEEGDGDIDVEGEGPIPNYARSMLSMELSDGATTLKAMEYRNLPQLRLGTTPLGYKLMLKDCKVRGGIALLEPRCVTLKGHQTADREATQRGNFARSLHLRLGLEPPEVEMEDPPQPAPGRSPLREMAAPRPPSPALHDHMDDEDQPRRRRVPDTSSSATTLVNPTSTYFDGPSQVDGQLMASLPLSPAGPSFGSHTIYLDSDDEKPTAPIRVQDASSDFGDDDFFTNEDVWAAAETQAVRSTVSGPSSSTVGETVDQQDDMDIIDISDDDDKENVPLPTRHVRRRVKTPPADDVDFIELSD